MWLKQFYSQPNRRYRNFQIVYALLSLNFLIPSVSYLVDPDGTYQKLLLLGRMLGESGAYPKTEDSYVWRFLGVSDVFALGFMCVLLQWNLRRFYPVLPALVVLKAATALQFLGTFALVLRYRPFLAIGLFDALTCVAFVYFARAAHRSLGATDAGLVPQPRGGGGGDA